MTIMEDPVGSVKLDGLWKWEGYKSLKLLGHVHQCGLDNSDAMSTTCRLILTLTLTTVLRQRT